VYLYSTHFLCICATQALASAQVQLNERSDELVIRTRRVKNLEQQLEDVEEAHKYVALFFFLVCISLAPRLLVCISLPTRHEQGCGRGAQVCVSIHLSSCLFASLLQRGMVKGVKECPGGVHKYTQQLKHTCSLTDTHTHRGTDINRTHQHKHTHKCACAHTRTHTNMRSHKTAHMRSTATYTHIQIHAYTNAHMHTQGSWCMPTCYRGGGGGAEHAPDHMAAQTHIHIHAHTRTHTHTKQTCTHTHICTHRGAGACIRALEEEVEELNTRLIMWQQKHTHIQIHAHTQAHTQKQTCTHTHICTHRGAEHAPDHVAAQTPPPTHTPTPTHTRTHSQKCTHRGAGASVRALEEEVEELNTCLIIWQHKHTHIHAHTNTNTHAPTQMHTQGSWCTCTCSRGGGGGAEHAPDHMAAQTYTHARTHTQTQTRMHSHKCTHTHTHSHECTHRGAGARVRALEEEVEELNTRLIM
jgi:hypothetical protein